MCHNVRGVGLPYCFQYSLYFLFLTFGVANYTRGGWPGVANYTLVFLFIYNLLATTVS